MRLLVHDFSGHPFQVQLSRELAGRGHKVLHLHCPSYISGKGDLKATPSDPGTFQVEGVDLGEPFAKHSARRLRHEVRYGHLIAERAARHQPDWIVSSNTPLLAQRALLARARREGIRFLFWQQDVYSVAMAARLRAAVPVMGRAGGAWLKQLEARMLRDSDAVVTISPDFRPILKAWGVAPSRTEVIENWAPLAELPQVHRNNTWAEEHGLSHVLSVVYAGTLGMKHDPGLLLGLAASLQVHPGVHVTVVSEGDGADRLAAEARRHGLGNISVLPFQSFSAFSAVLGSADVLIGILERDAGRFSVPSKILSYLCAGRPVVAALPRENLAARLLQRAACGVVVDPGDGDGLAAATIRLLDDPDRRRELGRRARAYAEETFDITTIGDRFERILTTTAGIRRPLVSPADRELMP